MTEASNERSCDEEREVSITLSLNWNVMQTESVGANGLVVTRRKRKLRLHLCRNFTNCRLDNSLKRATSQGVSRELCKLRIENFRVIVLAPT